ncbi:MAG: ribose transport system permease protein, partial [Streptomyces sp.]|nr:ribose transport system permease protein [Streptomyces sp.]
MTTQQITDSDLSVGRTRWQDVVRRTEFTLAVIAVVGYVVLAATTHGSVVSGDTLTAIFQFLAVPMVIGLSQMAVLSVGQMNLSVGVLTGFCAMVCAWLMVAAGLPAWLAVAGAVLTG